MFQKINFGARAMTALTGHGRTCIELLISQLRICWKCFEFVRWLNPLRIPMVAYIDVLVRTINLTTSYSSEKL